MSAPFFTAGYFCGLALVGLAPVPTRGIAKDRAQVHFQIRRTLAKIVDPTPEVVETALDTPTHRGFDRQTFAGVVANTTIDAVPGVVQKSVTGARIGCWTVAITATNEIARDKKFPNLVWSVAKPRFREDRPHVEPVVDFPIEPANRNDWILLERIRIESRYKIKAFTNLHSSHDPDRDIKRISGDVVPRVINTGLKLQQREKFVACPV